MDRCHMTEHESRLEKQHCYLESSFNGMTARCFKDDKVATRWDAQRREMTVVVLLMSCAQNVAHGRWISGVEPAVTVTVKCGAAAQWGSQQHRNTNTTLCLIYEQRYKRNPVGTVVKYSGSFIPSRMAQSEEYEVISSLTSTGASVESVIRNVVTLTAAGTAKSSSDIVYRPLPLTSTASSGTG
jgi:hypothetical protein